MQSASARTASGSSENAIKADINVTPLVDVCLVLLIIFMVVTPLLLKGQDVSLPETAKPEKMPEGAKQLNVFVKEDKSVVIGQDWVPKERLAQHLKDVYTAKPDSDVVIKGDRRLKYKEVREVMRLLNEAGFSGVGLVAEKKGG
jgi:biopolymer transport protein ExbD